MAMWIPVSFMFLGNLIPIQVVVVHVKSEQHVCLDVKITAVSSYASMPCPWTSSSHQLNYSFSQKLVDVKLDDSE